MKNHPRRLPRHPAAASSQKPNSHGKTKQPEGKGPEGSSTKKGAWGGEAAGTDANVGVVSVRVVAVPEGGAGVVRIVDPRAAAQQLGDPPSTATYARNRVLTMPQGRR